MADLRRSQDASAFDTKAFIALCAELDAKQHKQRDEEATVSKTPTEAPTAALSAVPLTPPWRRPKDVHNDEACSDGEAWLASHGPAEVEGSAGVALGSYWQDDMGVIADAAALKALLECNGASGLKPWMMNSRIELASAITCACFDLSLYEKRSDEDVWESYDTLQAQLVGPYVGSSSCQVLSWKTLSWGTSPSICGFNPPTLKLGMTNRQGKSSWMPSHWKSSKWYHKCCNDCHPEALLPEY
jgi:hypothetical protein